LGSEQLQQVFFNEARLAGKLSHPCIVSIYDAFAEEDDFFLIMEYIDGKNLNDYCHDGKQLPIKLAIRIIYQCARALGYAHEHGVIHRDIKPSNIMLTNEGDAKISDFGIALMNGSPNISSSYSAFTGSIYYTAPEQIRGEAFSPQTDLFALGVVMYELLAGVKPFIAETAIATLFKINNEDPKSLNLYRSDVDRSLQQIIQRMLCKDPSKRYENCLHVASALSDYHESMGLTKETINFEEKFDALKKIHFFKDFTSNELAEVIQVAQWVVAKAHEKIIIEDQLEDGFYIIISGEVMVKKHEKPLAVLKPGDCFGEMAYLAKIRRTATIEAMSDTYLLKINASSIEKMSTDTQLSFYKVFSITLIQRLNMTSEKLTRAVSHRGN
jgi:eukaryotic-like serine/threonine-protein kinase